jgi:hypothetical protein
MRYGRLTSRFLSAAIASVLMSSATYTTAVAQDMGGTGTGTAADAGRDAQSANVRLPDGVQARDVSDRDTRGIRSLLGSATIYAIKGDSFGDLVNHLNDQDRDRIGKNDQGNDNDVQRSINARVNEIRADWKAKYGHDVDFNDDGNDAAYSRALILRGEITDPAAVVKNWPLKAVNNTMHSTQDAQVDPNDGNANLEAGREVAVAVLNAPMVSQPAGTPDTNRAPAMSPVVVSIIGEVQNWKIDIPNSIDAPKLRQNLLNHLTAFSEMKGQWPANEHDAQLILTRHVAMALYDVPVPASTADAK